MPQPLQWPQYARFSTQAHRATVLARISVAFCIMAMTAYVVATAGPGNGSGPTAQRGHVTLPTVVIVGKRELPQEQARHANSRGLVEVLQ